MMGYGPQPIARGPCEPIFSSPPPCPWAPRAGPTTSIAGCLKQLRKMSFTQIGKSANLIHHFFFQNLLCHFRWGTIRSGLSGLFSKPPYLIHTGSKGHPRRSCNGPWAYGCNQGVLGASNLMSNLDKSTLQYVWRSAKVHEAQRCSHHVLVRKPPFLRHLIPH